MRQSMASDLFFQLQKWNFTKIGITMAPTCSWLSAAWHDSSLEFNLVSMSWKLTQRQNSLTLTLECSWVGLAVGSISLDRNRTRDMTEKYFVLFSTRKTFSNKTYFVVAAAYVRFCLQELRQENFERAKKTVQRFFSRKNETKTRTSFSINGFWFLSFLSINRCQDDQHQRLFWVPLSLELPPEQGYYTTEIDDGDGKSVILKTLMAL